jgi:hypothetical protein
MLLLPLILGIALFVYASLPKRTSIRSRMDTTPADLRRADDDKGDGNPDDPWLWMYQSG